MNKIQKIIVSSALVLFVNSSWATEVEEQTLLNNLAYGQLIEPESIHPRATEGLDVAPICRPRLAMKLVALKRAHPVKTSI